jgi:hypothetical protein
MVQDELVYIRCRIQRESGFEGAARAGRGVNRGRSEGTGGGGCIK